MCGIVAIVRNPVVTSAPDIGDLFGPIEAAMAQVAGVARDLGAADSASVLNQAAAHIGEVDRRLRPLGGIAVLVGDAALSARIAAAAVAIDASVTDIEEQLARGSVDTSRLESLNAALQALKDAVWMVSRDRLRTAQEVSIFVDANGPTTALELRRSPRMRRCNRHCRPSTGSRSAGATPPVSRSSYRAIRSTSPTLRSPPSSPYATTSSKPRERYG